MARDPQPSLFNTEPMDWEIDAARTEVVATVVFTEAPRGEFDYIVPPDLQDRLMPGARVRVPLGRGNRLVDAYCTARATKEVHAHRLKQIGKLIDDPPLVTPEVLELARWIAEYYVCDLGPVLETVVPASVRGKAGTREQTFWHAPTAVVARLTQLKLPDKQSRVVHYLATQPQPVSTADVTRAVGCTAAPLRALAAKKLIRAEKKRVFVDERVALPEEAFHGWTLNEEQSVALQAIVEAIDSGKHETILLHGVTGSGKTEVYIQAIQHMLGFGRQAIVLVPEISLTPQTRRRFRERLEGVAVLHSHQSPGERHWEWRRIQQGEVNVVVGARSAIFAPVPNLGLIVIDEEHESTFKQDTVPRYHARDVARRRASEAGIPLILGSATPSLESWYRARRGDDRLVSMPSRVADRPLPVVTTIDLRDEFRRPGARGALAQEMVVGIEEALADGGQVILLLNRRGFSTHIQCPACGEALRCPSCDIALTHHANVDRIVCHYCDYQEPTPSRCPHCRFEGIRFGGLGTERLEAEVCRRFPEASVLRMDTDTMRKPGSHEEALDRFRRGEVAILLGTQMIAKGLDFPTVTLVGVINADTALHLPDFRAGERTFQLVTQVAGRTGRGERRGKVLVQSYNPDHFAISSATQHDYVRFADRELEMRREFNYPPVSQLIRIVFRGPVEEATQGFADQAADCIRQRMERAGVGTRMLGPVAAPLAKLRGKFRVHFLIQTDDLMATAHVVREIRDELKPPSEVQWIVDVDAISML